VLVFEPRDFHRFVSISESEWKEIIVIYSNNRAGLFFIEITFTAHWHMLFTALLLLPLQSLVDLSIFPVLEASQYDSLMGVGLSSLRRTPKLEDQIPLLIWVITLRLSGMGGLSSSYATASIAFRVI
jgi:hypothetical protein